MWFQKLIECACGLETHLRQNSKSKCGEEYMQIIIKYISVKHSVLQFFLIVKMITYCLISTKMWAQTAVKRKSCSVVLQLLLRDLLIIFPITPQFWQCYASPRLIYLCMTKEMAFSSSETGSASNVLTCRYRRTKGLRAAAGIPSPVPALFSRVLGPAFRQCLFFNYHSFLENPRIGLRSIGNGLNEES